MNDALRRFDMEQVPPGSESTMQEQQEKYPNDWPVITPEQERIKLGLPAVPPMPEVPATSPDVDDSASGL